MDVGSRTLGTLSGHKVLQGAAEAARSLVDADLVAISLREGGVVAVAGHRSRALEVARTIEPDIVRRVTELSGPVHVQWNLGEGEPASDPEAVQATQEEGVSTTVAVPILSGDTTIGILWAHSRERRDFTVGEVSLLQGVAAEVASAIPSIPAGMSANGSAGLPEAEPALQVGQHSEASPAETAATREKQQLEALLTAAGRLNAAKETEEVLRCAVAIGAELLKARRAGIATDEAGAATRRYAVVDGADSSDESALDADLTLAGPVFKQARPFRGDQTGLAVPIFRADGSVQASLYFIDRHDDQPFTADDERLAEGIAKHAAVALERCQLVDGLRRSEELLRQRALTDPLTGLPNRTLFQEHLSRIAARPEERARGIAVLSLDLDGFKLVNDSLGHDSGDEVLKIVAQRIASCIAPQQMVARLGGDEFAVLLSGISDPSEAVTAARRIIAELEHAPTSGGQGMFVSVSAGIAFRGRESGARPPGDMMREADVALYQAKALGKSQAALFTPAMGEAAVERQELRTALQGALDRGELQLVYQPIVELKGGSAVGAEALMRWQRPGRPVLQPDSFIPLAEETGAIFMIGRWTLMEACRHARDWPLLTAGTRPSVSVNLSACQFEQRDLMRQVRSALDVAGLEPSALQLEIAETTIIQNPRTAVATLGALKALGVSIAVDNFGSGFSSLNCLHQLPVDWLKIDGAFVRSLRAGAAGAAAIEAIIAMAHALGIRVTAEGVETRQQYSILADVGCDCAQGHYISHPVPADDLNGTWSSTPPDEMSSTASS
ncbi:MAG TPA: EAL domain-containing protein [Dehalococcoidia bacterium]|nr:EAL domain-containing protein [Dehalococcoidia bacterium]